MLSSPTGGAVLDSERSLAVLTILDSGGAGASPGGRELRGFDEVGVEVVEQGQTQAVIRVERSNGETGAVSVSYSTADGSASAGLDYQAVSGTLSWASGDETAKSFNVPVFADTLSEGNESVLLELANPTGGATLDPAQGSSILNILDDDGSTSPCEPGDDSGCAQGSRFAIEATYRTGNGLIGRGQMVPLSGNTVGIWFFSPDNIEVLVKTLDACGFTSRPAYWLFYAATTNVDFTLRVTDTHTGLVTRSTRTCSARSPRRCRTPRPSRPADSEPEYVSGQERPSGRGERLPRPFSLGAKAPTAPEAPSPPHPGEWVRRRNGPGGSTARSGSPARSRCTARRARSTCPAVARARRTG